MDKQKAQGAKPLFAGSFFMHSTVPVIAFVTESAEYGIF